MKVLSAYEQKNTKLKLSLGLERYLIKWETVHMSKITH